MKVPFENERLLKIKRDDVLAELNRRIEILKELQTIYENIVVPTINKFNGKVYNIRFIKALREAINDNLVNVYEMDYNNFVKIEKRYERFNYTKSETMYVEVCVNKEGRIDAELTFESKGHKNNVGHIGKAIETTQDTLDNFEGYLSQARELYDRIEEFNRLPYEFRKNVERYRFTLYM
jgi:hypothetical protein